MKRRILVILLIFIIIVFVGCETEKNNKVISVYYTGFGANRVVGGALHRLTIGSDDYIIDVGSFYRDEGENYPLSDDIDISNIRGIFITHAHADHIGRLPLLIEMGYSGPIYMTKVTKDILLINISSNIAYADVGIETFYYSKNNKNEKKPVYLERFNYGQYQVKEKNRRYIKSLRSELEEKGYYLSSETKKKLIEEIINKLNKMIITVDYNEIINLKNGVSCQFIYTSHLPGSAMIKFNIGNKNVLFSGDIGSNNSPFLPPNSQLDFDIDYLFVEGTYGTTTRENNTNDDRKALIEYIGDAIRNNERVIIPAFAVDRTQQLLYELKNGKIQGIIPKDKKIKVFSPTSQKITELYKSYSRRHNELSEYFTHIMFTDIFSMENLIFNPTDENNSYDLEVLYGEIGIMTSGMIASGFSKEIVKEYISDEKTHFISVSYQDPDETGGKLFRGDKEIEIDGKVYDVKANIYSTSAFSGHADIQEIHRVFQNINPKQIYIIHLNSKDKKSLEKFYSITYSSSDIIVPEAFVKYFMFETDFSAK